VVFLVFEGFLAVDLMGSADAFFLANLIAPKPLYELEYVSAKGGPVTTAASLVVHTKPATDVLSSRFDTFIVAGGPFVEDTIREPSFISLVQLLARKARRICSICTGAFVLAAAGLLDGKRAVTHWASCELLQSLFPAVRVEVDPIFIHDGGVWTSAGITAGTDLTLALIRNDYGGAIAGAVAKAMVVFVQRPGGQAQFSAPLRAQTASAKRDDPVHVLSAFIAENLAGDLSVTALAREAGMAPRTLARLLAKRSDKLTPAKLVEAVRVEAACRALSATTRPVKDVAAMCGFGDDERMRRAFLRKLGVAPSDYRARFSPA
jgi:transcriptional regulator GlxA family with amidase domain